MTVDVRQFSSDKILKHLDRINAWLDGGNPAPITVELDVTNVCNHRCPECTGNYFRSTNSNSLPRNLAKSIIKQLAKHKVRGLIFTGGGEPLCYPHIGEMVKLAHGLGLDVGFITNGSLINDAIARVLLKYCTWLRVSLDAASPETFKKVHGLEGEAFKKVVDNLGLLAKLKKKLKSKTTIGVGYLTADFTKNQMHDAVLLCKRAGVDYLQFRPLSIHKGGKFVFDHLNIEEEMSRCTEYSSDTFRILFSQHKYEMMHDSNYGRNYKKCYGHQFATVVGADASVYLCCHMRGHSKYCIGNLKKHTFDKIWNSKKRKDVVSRIDFKDCVPLCRDNTFNQVLWNIKQPREHVNFL